MGVGTMGWAKIAFPFPSRIVFLFFCFFFFSLHFYPCVGGRRVKRLKQIAWSCLLSVLSRHVWLSSIMIGIHWQTSSAPELRSRKTYDKANRTDSLIKKTSDIQGIDKPNKDNRRKMAPSLLCRYTCVTCSDVQLHSWTSDAWARAKNRRLIRAHDILKTKRYKITDTDELSRCRCA